MRSLYQLSRMGFSLATLMLASAFSTEPVWTDSYIEEIMVVGARLSRPVEDVVGHVDVVSREDLVYDISTSLGDLVRHSPGVSVVEQDTRFGESEFTIRGLSGNRVASLIDGVLVPDQFDVGAFSNAGQDFLIPDSISRVEILRGPASTLFGSDALGGVVAFVTRDPEEYLQGEKGHLGASGIYNGRDNSTTANVSSAYRAQNLSAVVHLSSMQGEQRDAKAADVTDLLDRDRKSAMLKINYDLGNSDRLIFKLDKFDERVDTQMFGVLGSGRRFRNTTELKGDDRTRRDSIALAYQFSSDMSWLDRGMVNAYGQRTRVKQITGEQRGVASVPVDILRSFDYRVEHAGITVDLESSFSSAKFDHRVGWGASFVDSSIIERRDGYQTILATGETTNVLIGETLPVRDFPKSQVTELAAYLYDEISFADFTLIPGLRLESYKLDAQADELYLEDNPDASVVDVSSTSLAPKLGFLWKLNDRHSVFAQYSYGFRAPPFEDVNIGLDIPRFNIRAIPNPDLSPETSNGLELGIRSHTEFLRWSISAFGARYKNLIQTKANLGIDPESGVLLFQSINVERADVYGLEFTLAADLDRWLEGLNLYFAGSWTRGKNQITDKPLNTVDPAELVTSLVWQGQKSRLSLIHTLVAAKNDVDNSNIVHVETSGFSLVDLNVSYTFTPGFQVDAGIYNLFDKTYWRWSSVRNRQSSDPLVNQLSAPGRYARVSARFNF